MPQDNVIVEQNSFSPSALLQLFELDARSINGSRLYFHPGVNGKYEPVIFNGIEYTPFPIEVSDMEIDGKGTLPRISIKAANVNGVLSLILANSSNLIGAKLIRRRVFARFIDDANWKNNSNPYGTADPNAAYEDEIFYINRKVSENREMVEFEGVTPLELDDVKLPNRPILAGVCPFKYRHGKTCGYTAGPVCDRFGKTFTGDYGYTLSDQGTWSPSTTYTVGQYVVRVSEIDQTYGDSFVFVCKTNGTVGTSNDPLFNQSNWIMDACPHTTFGCKLHFPTGALNYGGFLGVNKGRFQ